jgi:prepilin-type N-terminal cleavage/methylation domain-containing protein
MKVKKTGFRRRRGGYTLTEVVIALMIFTMVSAGFVSAFVKILYEAKTGSAQLRHMAAARAVEQMVMHRVQDGRAITIMSNALFILNANNTYSSFEYKDTDNRPGTVTNNYFIYDPDTDVASNETIVCRDISPLGTQAVFSCVAASPRDATVCFHLGESTNFLAPTIFGKSMGIRGVEVRFSATPRNLQYWYQ